MNHPLVNIHTHKPDHSAINITSVLLNKPGQAYPAPPFSLGIHPWDNSWLDVRLRQALLKEIEKCPDLAAIGEIGLDYSRDIIKEVQQEVFESQLTIAQQRQLPVVLHCVHAFEPVMKTLSHYKLKAVIFHGFTGNAVQAETAVKAGYFLSFGSRSLNIAKAVEAMRTTPRGRMFLETDASDIPITEVYARAAEILQVGVDELAADLYENYKKLFG